jgi:hypothetical protein
MFTIMFKNGWRMVTVISVDNIDFSQSGAFVFSGDHSRSWHGTTIQAVQPLPQANAPSHKRRSEMNLNQVTDLLPSNLSIVSSSFSKHFLHALQVVSSLEDFHVNTEEEMMLFEFHRKAFLCICLEYQIT